MKKNIFKLLSLIIICTFLLPGCAKMTILSDEDTQKSAIYVAGVISKFNKNQRRGIVPVSMVPQEEQEDENSDFSTMNNSDYIPKPTDVNAPTSDGGESDLTKIAEIPYISFSYKDMTVSQDYGQDSGFLINPQEGNSFVAVTFMAKNGTEEDIVCNIQQRALNFTAVLGDVTSAVDRTILANDLTTYNETIPAGGSVELALLFQFPTEKVSDLSGLELNCFKEGVKYNVPF